MYIIPNPKLYKIEDGKFKITKDIVINLEHKCDSQDLESAIELQKELKDIFGFKVAITKSFRNNNFKNAINIIRENIEGQEAYKLKIDKEGIRISGGTSTGIFYGIQTLKQIIRQSGSIVQYVSIEDEPYFKNRGFYHDVTRGKVPTLKTLKELVDKATFYKINQIQLYIEHSFAFKGMSEVWIDKDPLTSEEILLLDEYCRKRHIELIPSISTFGHLYEVLRTKSFSNLCELEGRDVNEYSFVDRMAHHTLNVSDEKALEFIEDMLNQFIPLFSSKKFNIGCDETFDLGKGKSKGKADNEGIGKLYVDFLNRVITIVKKHDKKVMFWGDVILNYQELLGEIPDDVVCLNWNYNYLAEEEGTKIIAESGREQYVCPGVAGWSQLMNFIENGFININKMISYGVKYEATGVLNTDWGDYGHINLLSNSIPGMAYGAWLSWNPETDRPLEEIYSALSIVEYGDESLQIVNLLKELGKSQRLGWSEIVRWKEKYNIDENIKAEFLEIKKSVKVEDIIKGYNTALDIEEKITSLLINVNDKEPLQDFIISARGIALINDFFLVFMQKEFKDEKVKSFNSPWELAEKLEEWFVEYGEAWRKRNKESELHRIREVIIYVCSYLREASSVI